MDASFLYEWKFSTIIFPADYSVLFIWENRKKVFYAVLVCPNSTQYMEPNVYRTSLETLWVKELGYGRPGL